MLHLRVYGLAATMERVAEPAFTPENRIGALELQNLSVADNRALLLRHLETLAPTDASRAALAELLGEGKA